MTTITPTAECLKLVTVFNATGNKTAKHFHSDEQECFGHLASEYCGFFFF